MRMVSCNSALRGCRLKMLIIAVLVFVAPTFPKSQATQPQAQPDQKVGSRIIELPGQVESSEKTKLYAKIIAYVQKIHVAIGDRVKKGQVLAELSVPEIQAEHRQKALLVAQAEAEVALARRALQTAEASLVLATAQVEEAEAGIKRARANDERWKTEYERLEKLWQGKVIDKQLRDQGMHRLEIAKAGLVEAEAKVKAAKAARDANAAKRDMVQGEIRVAMAREEVARAEVKRVDTLRQYARILAPFDGVIARRSAETGALVGPGDRDKAEPLFVLARIDAVRISIGVPETSVPFVTTDTRVSIRFPAFKGKEVEAKVTRLAGALDPDTRTLRAEIDLPNVDGKLLPGMFAVVVIAGSRPDAELKKATEAKEATNLADPKALLEPLLDAARKAYEEAVKGSQQARRAGTVMIPLAKSEDVYIWSVRWLNAQLELNSKKDDRIAALEGHLERMKALQTRVTEMYKAGLASSLEVAAVEFHRVQAQLWLARETKEQNNSKSDPQALFPAFGFQG